MNNDGTLKLKVTRLELRESNEKSSKFSKALSSKQSQQDGRSGKTGRQVHLSRRKTAGPRCSSSSGEREYKFQKEELGSGPYACDLGNGCCKISSGERSRGQFKADTVTEQATQISDLTTAFAQMTSPSKSKEAKIYRVNTTICSKCQQRIRAPSLSPIPSSKRSRSSSRAHFPTPTVNSVIIIPPPPDFTDNSSSSSSTPKINFTQVDTVIPSPCRGVSIDVPSPGVRQQQQLLIQQQQQRQTNPPKKKRSRKKKPQKCTSGPSEVPHLKEDLKLSTEFNELQYEVSNVFLDFIEKKEVPFQPGPETFQEEEEEEQFGEKEKGEVSTKDQFQTLISNDVEDFFKSLEKDLQQEISTSPERSTVLPIVHNQSIYNFDARNVEPLDPNWLFEDNDPQLNTDQDKIDNDSDCKTM